MTHPPRMDGPSMAYPNGAIPGRDQYTYMPLPHHQAHHQQQQYEPGHSQPGSAAVDGMMRPVASNRHIRTQSQSQLQSGHEEVQAGLALATMGMGMSPSSMQARSDGLATPPDVGVNGQGGAHSKKAKMDKVKKEERDKLDVKEKPADGKVELGPNGQPLAKRACAECRRLKAKCE